jgi:hypothetical protein
MMREKRWSERRTFPAVLVVALVGLEPGTAVLPESVEVTGRRIEVPSPPKRSDQTWARVQRLTRDLDQRVLVGLHRVCPEHQLRNGSPSGRLVPGGRTVVIADAPLPPPSWEARLKELLRRRSSFDAEPKRCMISPGVWARLAGTSDTTEVLLCFKCAQIELRRGTEVAGGDFDRQWAAYVRLVQEAFPADSTLQALDPDRLPGGLDPVPALIRR